MNSRACQLILSLCLPLIASPAAHADTDSYWFLRADLPNARQESPIVLLDTKLYVATGLDQVAGTSAIVEAFDLTANTWTGVTPTPLGRHHSTMNEVGGKLYLIGGYNSYVLPWIPQANCWEYDPSVGSWVDKAPIPMARAEHISVVFGGRIHCIGGRDGFGEDVNAHHIYNPATDTWSTGPGMPSARNHCAAAVIDSLIYVVGGRNAQLQNTNLLQAFSPSSGTWYTKAPMPTARGGLMAATMNGILYVFGGEFFNGPNTGVFAEVEAYDPATNTWSTLADAPHPRHGTQAVTVGDTIFIIGGAIVAGTGVSPLNEGFVVGVCNDIDDDGFGDPLASGNTCPPDNCPGAFNPSQQDQDGDGIGDACDVCPADAPNDPDSDGICQSDDNCPNIANADQTDTDQDGIGDACCCVAATGNVDCSAGDGVDVADLTALIDNLFIGFTPLCCAAEANCDGVGTVDVGDLTALIDNLFINFSPLSACS